MAIRSVVWNGRIYSGAAQRILLPVASPSRLPPRCSRSHNNTPPSTRMQIGRTKPSEPVHDGLYTSCVMSLVTSPCSLRYVSSLPRTEVSRADCPRLSDVVALDQMPPERPSWTPSDRTRVRSASCPGWSSDSGLRRRQGAPSGPPGWSDYSLVVTATRWTPSAASCVGAWSGHTSPGRVEAAGRGALRRCMSLEWAALCRACVYVPVICEAETG